MDYTSIFDPIPWDAVGHSILQTIAIYWLLLLGLKLVGRRVFGEMGPQDLIILLLIAEACDLGLSDEKAGFWGTIASVLTILAMGGLIERLTPLRQLLEERSVTLMKNGRLDRIQMRRNMVQEEDLNHTAREYGLASYRDFELMTLESDGKITGIVRPEKRNPGMTKPMETM